MTYSSNCRNKKESANACILYEKVGTVFINLAILPNFRRRQSETRNKAVAQWRYARFEIFASS